VLLQRWLFATANVLFATLGAVAWGCCEQSASVEMYRDVGLLPLMEMPRQSSEWNKLARVGAYVLLDIVAMYASDDQTVHLCMLVANRPVPLRRCPEHWAISKITLD
jgi:hypothetical protein